VSQKTPPTTEIEEFWKNSKILILAIFEVSVHFVRQNRPHMHPNSFKGVNRGVEFISDANKALTINGSAPFADRMIILSTRKNQTFSNIRLFPRESFP
jgi:hypothetical protein